jgi:hypothetical protein
VDLGLRACDDLWKVYFTSSKTVKKMNREEFDPFVLAEFKSPIDAIRLEQRLLDEAWLNPLLLNHARIYGDKYNKLLLCNVGNVPSAETLAKRSESLKKVVHTPEWVHKISVALTGRKVIRSEETQRAYREKRVGKKWNQQSRERLSEAQQLRFQSEEQRDLNRKAWEAAFEVRKKDFKKLVVILPSGEEQIYETFRDFHQGNASVKQLIYSFIKKDRPVKSGKFEGYRFEEAA